MVGGNDLRKLTPPKVIKAANKLERRVGFHREERIRKISLFQKRL